ncbi:prepilin-type N-terminal cleavage/methylation domain-containing protein [Candidatus Microgenomates bacterium]|nr:prepilin-type N-terminal cleavage/methylation domain-containing protein [Candidatus Microgenomates bacterium]
MKFSKSNFQFSIFNSQFSIPSQGFTLIELLIAIAIVGIMGAVFVTTINPSVQFKKANDTERKSALRQIQAGLELYRADQSAYPASLPNCGSALALGGTTYLQKVPCDPKNTGQYVYRYIRNGTQYTLIACLENTNDPQKDTANNITYCTGSTTNWSYTLTNP